MSVVVAAVPRANDAKKNDDSTMYPIAPSRKMPSHSPFAGRNDVRRSAHATSKTTPLMPNRILSAVGASRPAFASFEPKMIVNAYARAASAPKPAPRRGLLSRTAVIGYSQPRGIPDQKGQLLSLARLNLAHYEEI